MVALKKSKRYWLTKRSDGTTPIHDAAANGHLNKIQRELLTTDTLLTRTSLGLTPLHLAASNGHLDQIPQEILNGHSPKAARIGILKRLQGAFNNIPIKNYCHGIQSAAYYFQNLDNTSNLLIPDINGFTPL